MKRIICVMLVVITMMCLLTACGGKCALCGKQSGNLHKTYDPNVVIKQEIKVCDECYASMGGGEVFLQP